MATSSGKFYLVEGCKISLELLKSISNDIPAPGSSIVNLVSQAVTAVETAKSNQELWERLRNLLLSIVPVVLETLNSSARGKTIPPNLKQSVDRLHATLQAIVEEVAKLQSSVKSKRFRRKVAAIFFGNAHANALKKCCDDLDWAMKEFDVSSRLGDAVRLCEVLEKTREIQARTRLILTNQLLHSLPRAKYAGFDCERPDKPSNCFEGTRMGILKDIRDWMASIHSAVQRIFWLKGIAGVGKTTVARTIAQQALDDGILGAQFFFSRRGEAELRNPALVFSTIAYQLARFDPEFGEHIIAALEMNPDAAFSSLKDQLDKLIVEPLSHVERDPKRVVLIVFDAFDECEANGARQILQLLINAIPRLPFYLKILVTSRPEPHIQSVLLPSNNLHITALHDIEASIVASDIHLYLRHRLRNLPKELGIDLTEDWITDDEIDLLADKAGNLFIHAATSIRFLLESFDLRAQLDRLLKIVRTNRRSSRGDKPFVDLDELYLEILRGLITRRNTAEAASLFQPVIGTITLLRDPLPVDALSRLIGLGDANITNFLAHLSSVLLPPSSSDPCPRIYHPSFPDFLQDESRCTDERFRIDNKKHEARMALRCLNLIGAQLHKGMLGDVDPALLNRELTDREQRVRDAFSLELQYACRYWAAHFLAAMEGDVDPAFVKSFETFVAKSLVPWVEAMSWLDDARPCLASLEAINAWVTPSSCSPSTKGLLNDAHRMVLAHFSTINLGAQHIARSVFPFLPHNIHLRTQYPDYIDPAITALSGVDPVWPACMTVLKSHSDTIRSVAFSPDGSRLASASDDKTVHICDAMGGGSLVVLEHSEGVNCVAFSRNGSLLATASDDSTVRIWDPISTSCVSVLEGHSDMVHSISFSPDGSRLASASGDATLRIWDTSTANHLSTLQGHSKWVLSTMFSPDGARLVSGSGDNTIQLWDAVSGDCLTIFRGHSNRVNSVALFPDGLQLASASHDQTIRVWDIAAGECIATLKGHSDVVLSVAISPDGTRLASGSEDRTIRVWDTTSYICLATLMGYSIAVSSVSYSPDGSRLASGSGDATVRIWDTSITGSPASVPGHSWCVKSVTFSPDGLHVASGSNDKTVRLWDAVTGRILATLEGHTDWVETVAFSPDGLLLASGSATNDTTVRLWDTTTNDCLATLDEHSSYVFSVAFSSNSMKLASGSADNTVRIWDIATRSCSAILSGHSDWVRSVAFSPDGLRIISGSDDQTVRVWDAAPATCHKVLDGHKGWVWSAQFSPSGSEIVTRSKEGDVRVWNAETGAVVDANAYEARTRTGHQLVFEGGKLFRIDKSGVKHLICILPPSYIVDPVYITTRTAFFDLGPDRARVALGCEDGTVLILDVALY